MAAGMWECVELGSGVVLYRDFHNFCAKRRGPSLDVELARRRVPELLPTGITKSTSRLRSFPYTSPRQIGFDYNR
jgi:hypothetical protein